MTHSLAQTYHGHGVGVGGSLGVPLHGHLTSRAGVGAVVARLTGLIGAHGPSSVLFTGSDGDQTSIGRELALSTLLLESGALRDGAGFVVAGMEMTVVSGLHARNESDERSGSGGRNVELHICRK